MPDAKLQPPEVLRAIRERRAAVTPVQWEANPPADGLDEEFWTVSGVDDYGHVPVAAECTEADAAFIANAPADFDALLQHIEAMRAVLRSVEWEGRDRDGKEKCIVCEGDYTISHASDCALAAALRGEAT